MVKFTDEQKEEFEQGNYFGPGVHKVKIGQVDFATGEDGKEYAEFIVLGEDGEEGTARVWFTTEAAIKYAFNTIRSIFVHNSPEDKKDEIRKKIDAMQDTEELAKACAMLGGKECWYTVYENPERTYTGKDGSLRNSFDRNVYGYEPKPRSVTPTNDDATPAPAKSADGDPGPASPEGDGKQPFGF